MDTRVPDPRGVLAHEQGVLTAVQPVAAPVVRARAPEPAAVYRVRDDRRRRVPDRVRMDRGGRRLTGRADGHPDVGVRARDPRAGRDPGDLRDRVDPPPRAPTRTRAAAADPGRGANARPRVTQWLNRRRIE